MNIIKNQTRNHKRIIMKYIFLERIMMYIYVFKIKVMCVCVWVDGWVRAWVALTPQDLWVRLWLKVSNMCKGIIPFTHYITLQCTIAIKDNS